MTLSGLLSWAEACTSEPGVSVNHSLSSEACEPRDRQDEEGLEGPIRGSVALTGETCVQKLER